MLCQKFWRKECVFLQKTATSIFEWTKLCVSFLVKNC
jgi:hypothetical protein